jgi:GTP-binding protein
MTNEFIPGLVAVIGRPNVGKSTFFNRLAKERVSIVKDEPGVTRDRIYREVEHWGTPFILCDTGGFEPKTDDPMLVAMRRQTQLAIEQADAVIFMTDGVAGLTGGDKEVANLLRRAEVPVFVAVNKCEAPDRQQEAWEFTQLGLGDIHIISAEHGLGIPGLMDALIEVLPTPEPVEEDDEERRRVDELLDELADTISDFGEDADDGDEDAEIMVSEALDEQNQLRFDRRYPKPDTIRLAVIGKPNAGKSSLVNTFLGEDRFLVSEIAGTTRDAVDAVFTRGEQRFKVVDTAGIRRKRSISCQIERYSVISALRALDRSDVAILLIDAQQGVTEQDAKIAAFAHDKGKAMIIGVNKWDAQPKGDRDRKEFEQGLRDKLKFLHYTQVRFLSAKTGKGVEDLVDEVTALLDRYYQHIKTRRLNTVIQDANAKHQAPSHRGRPIRLLFATQVRVAPPTMVIHTSHPEGINVSYRRYVVNRLRDAFDFQGIPVQVWYRKRDSHGGRNQRRKSKG